MDSLAEHGRYEVSGGVRRNLERDFSAGFCDDEAAKKTIAQVWNERKYLIDPHTAVAMNVLEQYRAEAGDTTPTLVASTASPFKFGPAVLEALGVAQPQQGQESIGQLAEFTGMAAPAPLVGLAGKRIRFSQTVEKDHMTDAVREMLL